MAPKPNWVGERWGTFMRVERNGAGYMSYGGDSGGPVYWGNTALGIQSGRYGTDGIYTAINFVQSSDMGIRCVQKSNKTC